MPTSPTSDGPDETERRLADNIGHASGPGDDRDDGQRRRRGSGSAAEPTKSAPTPPPMPNFEPTRSWAEARKVQPKQLQLEPADGTLRKGSVVSFKDVCELFEIDIEAQGGRPSKPAAVFSLRYYIMMLALVSPFVVTYSRTIINFALIDMIDPDYLGAESANHSTVEPEATPANPLKEFGPSGAPSLMPTTTTEQPRIAPDAPASYFDHDNSCPVDEETRARLDEDLQVDRRRAQSNSGQKFKWDTVRQGLLKAAYSLGHMLLPVIGGRLSEVYGSHLILGVSAGLIGACCLMAPFLAAAHFYLLFVNLLVLGALGGFMTPALITLFSNWLTPSEKSIVMSFYLVSSRLGYALSSLLCGLLIQAQLSWRYLFYSAGWIALAFSFVFLLCARSRPHEHPLIGGDELDYLVFKNTLVREAVAKSAGKSQSRMQMEAISEEESTKNGANPGQEDTVKVPVEKQRREETKSEGTQGAPWRAILTSVPVWAFIVTKFCVKLAGDTVQIELPTYLKRVMHMAPKHNGFVNASNYVIFCLSCLLVGVLAKWANKRRPFGWSKTAVRKAFQMTASFGVGFCLLGISMSVCKQTATLALLMLLFFLTTFSTGGEAQIPVDISERYAGTIHAIGGTLAISGVIEPILVGYMLKDYPADRDRWAGVWMGASMFAFLGGLVFALLGQATIQPFDKLGLEEPQEVRKKGDEEKGVDGVMRTVTIVRGYANKSFEQDEGKSEPEEPPFRESAQI